MTIKRKCSYLLEMGKDILGNLQRISNALGGIEKKMEETEAKIGNTAEAVGNSTGRSGEAFSKRKGIAGEDGKACGIEFPFEYGRKGNATRSGERSRSGGRFARRSVNYAGRVSEGRKGKIEKSSVLGRLKTTQRNMEKGWKNRNMQKKKQEQQL